MLRSVMLIFVGLPMLMPPGLCVCQFGIACRPAVGLALAGSTDVHSETDALCSCKLRHIAASVHDSAQAVLEHAGATGSVPRTKEHSPGCPASLGPTMARAAILAVPTAAPAVAEVAFERLAADLAESQLLISQPLARADAPALYLSQCTFLI